MADAVQISRLVAVVLLLVAAALVATPRGRLPLALRGLKKVLNAAPSREVAASSAQPVPAWKRLLAFLLVIVAFLLAVL